MAAATGAPALLLMCGCWGLVERSRRPSDGSEPSTDHSRYDMEQQLMAPAHVERNRQDLRLRALRRATQHVNVVYTERRGTWSSTAGARHGAAGPPASAHPWRARAISTKMQKDAHLHQHKRRPPRQVLGARVGTVGWPGVQGVAGRPGKRLRPRPVAHSPGPTAPEVAEERHTTPGRSARREELVRANGSIISGETQDLSFFWHVPPAC